MTKEGLQAQLKQANDELYRLEMKDSWSVNDHRRSYQLHDYMRNLEKQISDIEDAEGIINGILKNL